MDKIANENLVETIAKLEATLLDERKAKNRLIDDYNMLKEKYISNLQMLVKTQRILLNHKMYVDGVSNRRPIEANGPNPVDQPNSSNEEGVAEDNGRAYDYCQLLLCSKDQINVADHISAANMVKLKSIKSERRQDSTFIKTLMDMLYDDKDVLKFRSVTGKSREKNKHSITPVKMNILKQLFIKRVQIPAADNEEKISRLNEKYTNCLIGNAINNINRKKNIEFFISL